MSDRRMDEILEVLAIDVRRLADFARRLELTVFGSAQAKVAEDNIVELQKFDALIQHLDDLEAILRSVSAMTDPKETVDAEALSDVAKLGHYRRIFGLPCTTEPPPDPGHVDLF